MIAPGRRIAVSDPRVIRVMTKAESSGAPSASATVPAE